MCMECFSTFVNNTRMPKNEWIVEGWNTLNFYPDDTISRTHPPAFLLTSRSCVKIRMVFPKKNTKNRGFWDDIVTMSTCSSSTSTPSPTVFFFSVGPLNGFETDIARKWLWFQIRNWCFSSLVPCFFLVFCCLVSVCLFSWYLEVFRQHEKLTKNRSWNSWDLG